MKDVGAWGRTEGDSGEKAGKWVRGEDDDVEEKEEESDEARWRERDTRGRRKRRVIMEVWRAALPGCRKPNNKPNKSPEFAKNMNLRQRFAPWFRTHYRIVL